ncbi:adenosine deaminase [Testudinibacter sp. TR-2022]|uniref:adenosine deaminase n=1 Tax=Testudinibacter sp. TR-2022 TaxID=2585029 RepID=UPI00111B3194|nr:adenosine deaminase [Testudinibacter sp. TR-2022]TNH04904.1 adenosine deaminase [Pasteurellaceae bacterium Phil31]TNH09943.1 adenosine deaminase [Testudinibacter sp. TR-2022]TNH12401.1 adenosine deaminase [Testudinibacter sp. TR-2022]TNH16252.1 adenosine deaminase [Testudinibacter sp. TR-2022]TNH19268.1 adenosine deaminase [Testudinibacter sp. TR-2022]
MTALFNRTLPKVVLHEHIEGSVAPHLALQLAEKYQVRLPPDFLYQTDEYDAQDFPNGRYRYDESDFREFVKTYDTVADLVRDAQDYYWVTKDYLSRNAKQGLIYCELITSAFHMCTSIDEHGNTAWSAQRYHQIMQGIEQAIAEVRSEYGTETRLHACGVRHLPYRDMLASAEFIAQHPRASVTGFNIAGNEKAGKFTDFAELHQLVADIPLPKSYHAGEICGAESVRQAIQCGAVRIGHGIASIQDAELINLLIEQQITLEISPSSNRILVPELQASLAEHPLRKLYDAGVRVCINTDDAGLFGTDIEKEYRIAAQQFGFCRAELLDISLCALECAFVESAVKAQLIQQVYQQFSAQDWQQLADLIQTCPNPALKVRLQQRYQNRSN